MNGDVHVSLLVSVVLWDVVKVVTTDNNGFLHLCRDDYGLEDSSSDVHSAGEWALLVDVVSFDGLLWSLDAHTNGLEVAGSSLSLLGNKFLAVLEDILLLLI